MSVEMKMLAYKKSAKEGIIISFGLSPIDIPAKLEAAPINTRFMAVLVEVDNDTDKPVDRQKPEKKPTDPRVTRSAILCNTVPFIKFLEERFPRVWNDIDSTLQPPDRAAHCLRAICGITSRKELATSPEAIERFEILTGKYEMWRQS